MTERELHAALEHVIAETKQIMDEAALALRRASLQIDVLRAENAEQRREIERLKSLLAASARVHRVTGLA